VIEFPSFVPETMNLLQLFHSLQKQRRGLAVVLDEFGGVAGLVTMEDILGELVGKIRAESQPEGFVMEKIAPGRWRVNGTMRLDDFRREFPALGGVAEVETMGGLLTHMLGVVPNAGDYATRQRILDEMATRGLRPSHKFYHGTLRHVLLIGDVPAAHTLLATMKENNISLQFDLANKIAARFEGRDTEFESVGIALSLMPAISNAANVHANVARAHASLLDVALSMCCRLRLIDHAVEFWSRRGALLQREALTKQLAESLEALFEEGKQPQLAKEVVASSHILKD